MAEFKQLAINPAAPYARDTGQSINALIRAKTPPGGSTGQVLVKVSDDSWDMEWGAGSGSGASYTNEDARDAIGDALVAGSGISIVVDDALDTITISNTGTIAVRDEGITAAANATSIDFVGAGVTATAIGSNVTVSITGGTTITAKDEGSTLTSGLTSVDFVGAGVTATNVGGAVTVTIPAAAAYTDEQAQDAVGGILTGLSYNDGTPSISAIRVIQIQVTDPAGDALTTGDGKAYFRVNSQLNGYNLSGVAAAVTTVSSSGIPTIQIANVTDTVDMLSTKLTIDASETDSSTAATAAVIDTSKDDVATADMLRIDVDVAGTGTKGLIVELTFTLP